MAHSFTLRRGSLADRLARCLSVSVLTTLLSLSVLVALTAGFAVTAWVANVIATAAGTVPSYSLNRRWVWRRREHSSLSREVLPFWVMSFAGLVLSTVSVALADRWATAADLTGLHRSAVLATANVGAFGLLWVAQFLLLDRVLFARRPTTPATSG